MGIAGNRFPLGLLAVFLAAAATVSDIAAAQQDSGEQLVEKARCYTCHSASGESLGPPYLAIAARHAPRRDVMVDVLARKIVNGGGGNWGLVPMVPNQWVTIEEARRMSEWILSLAPK
jgi:cytochrome c